MIYSLIKVQNNITNVENWWCRGRKTAEMEIVRDWLQSPWHLTKRLSVIGQWSDKLVTRSGGDCNGGHLSSSEHEAAKPPSFAELAGSPRVLGITLSTLHQNWTALWVYRNVTEATVKLTVCVFLTNYFFLAPSFSSLLKEEPSTVWMDLILV